MVAADSPPATFYQWQDGDVILRILVQPKAGKDEIVGPHGDELKVRIQAPPVEGAANQAVVKFFSKLFKVPKSHITILSGETSRHKRLRIQAPKRLPKGIEAVV
jgi:uncharacterized protein (TIGR00251 family)